MASRIRNLARIRVSCVSLYLHHGAWWLYYRDSGKPVRSKFGNSFTVNRMDGGGELSIER